MEIALFKELIYKLASTVFVRFNIDENNIQLLSHDDNEILRIIEVLHTEHGLKKPESIHGGDHGMSFCFINVEINERNH